MITPARWFLCLLALTLVTVSVWPSPAPTDYSRLAKQAEQELAVELKKLADTGAPVKLTDLVKEPIPESRNAACMYRQAFASLPKDDTFYADVATGHFDWSNPDNLAKARTRHAEVARTIRLIQQAAAMPKCDWQTDFSTVAETGYPHHSQLLTCFRLLAFDAALSRQEGQIDAAMSTCRNAFLLSNAANDATLQGQSTRYTIIENAIDLLQRILDGTQPSADTCQSAADIIGHIELKAGFMSAIEGERAIRIWEFEQLRQNPDRFQALSNLSGQTIDRSRLPVDLSNPAGTRWWIATDELAYLSTVDKYRRIALMPDPQALTYLVPLTGVIARLPDKTPCPITLMLLSDYSLTLTRTKTVQARLGMTVMALLLKSYRASHSVYAGSLSNLTASEGKTPPNDPFTGKPFIFKRENQGFVVYSVGRNMKDDGGKVGKNPTEGDIVLRVTR